MARVPSEREIEGAQRLLARRNPKLRAVIRAVGPYRVTRRPIFPALLRSILHQQIAGAAAAAIEGRFKARFGGRYPRPHELSRIRPASLRAVGLSRQKAAAVLDAARAFQDGRARPRRLPHMNDDEVIECLSSIRGVGRWTAQMLLMSALGRLDVLATGDLGLRKGAQLVYGLAELPEEAALEQLGESWRPYRSIASWYLWRALEL